MPPVTKRLIPSWLDPRQASVMSPWWQSVSRTLAQLGGMNDPNTAVTTLMNPMTVPLGAVLKEGTTLAQLGGRFATSPFPVVEDDVAMPIYRAAKDASPTVQEVPLSRMVGTQSTVQPDIVAQYGSSSSSKGEALPQVVKSGDTYYIADGHHRLAALAQSGATTAKVEVLEAPTGAQPPVYQGWLDRMKARSF